MPAWIQAFERSRDQGRGGNPVKPGPAGTLPLLRITLVPEYIALMFVIMAIQTQ